MSTLCFFPWLNIKAPIDVAPIHLVQYRRGTQPGGADQPVIDKVTEPYHLARRSSILTATLLQFGEAGLLDDVGDTAIPEVFELATLITTGGLCSREFFGFGYWNRENFQFLIQRFTEPDRGVFFEARRLDGSSGVYVPHEKLVVSHPIHAGSGPPPEYDTDLLAALLRLRKAEDWPRFREACQVFNLANTDSPDVPIELTLVLMTGAFEQLLDAEAEGAELAARFESRLVPTTSTPLCECAERVSKLPRGRPPAGSLRAAWMRDLFALRGDLAHGRLSARYPSVWTEREHLLMGAFAFPLLLKQELADRGLYVLKTDDMDKVDAFETLCCAHHFAEPDEDDSDGRPWHRILAEAGLSRIADKWWAKYQEAIEGAADSNSGINGG